MTNIHSFGNIIKEKRLASNLRMDDVARMAGITRSTLWSIEKGNGNCSMNALFKVLDVLDLSFSIDGFDKDKRIRKKRASRLNSKIDKQINRFIIMCVEQYANHSNISSENAYKLLLSSEVIKELQNDYEDLHGMSTEYLNEYIDSLIKNNGTLTH